MALSFNIFAKEKLGIINQSLISNLSTSRDFDGLDFLQCAHKLAFEHPIDVKYVWYLKYFDRTDSVNFELCLYIGKSVGVRSVQAHTAVLKTDGWKVGGSSPVPSAVITIFNLRRSVTWTINLPLRQVNGSNSLRQLIGSNSFRFFKKVQTTLNPFVNCYPLFFSRTFRNLLVPKTPAIYWFQFFRKRYNRERPHESLGWLAAIIVNPNESYSVVGSSPTCGGIFCLHVRFGVRYRAKSLPRVIPWESEQSTHSRACRA